MARRYTVHGQGDVGTTKTVLGLTGATTVRPKIYDIVVGCAATPADVGSQFQLWRYTAAGTSTATYIIPLDPGDPASLCASGENHSGEPTYTANKGLAAFSINQRNTFRWVAAPGGELVIPATANNGIGLMTKASGGTALHEATFFFEE